MQATYNVWLVVLSIIVAIGRLYHNGAHTGRSRSPGERSGGRGWLLGGAAAMGIGIWSMHFIGNVGFLRTHPLRYNIVTTLVSLIIAILTQASPSRSPAVQIFGVKRLAAGSLVMGAGICAMHYTGMAAIQIMPTISYRPAARRCFDRDRRHGIVRCSLARLPSYAQWAVLAHDPHPAAPQL